MLSITTEGLTKQFDRHVAVNDVELQVEISAALLRSLVAANIPLTEFHCTQEDLETIFLKLEYKQVS